MKKEAFNNIMKKIEAEIVSCEKLQISSTDFDELKVSEARKIIDTARKLQTRMNKIVQAELYHIIGMGNLTMTQQSQFLSKIRELLNCRYKIKTIAAHADINKIGDKEKSKYNCEILDLNLKSQN